MTAGVPLSDSFYTLSRVVARMQFVVQHRHLWGFPAAFVALVLIVFVLTGTKWWPVFSRRHKYWSRIILCEFMITLLFFAAGTQGWVMSQIKGRFALADSITITSMAIKIGLYGVELNQQLAYKLPASERPLQYCVASASFFLAGKECPESGPASCIDDLPHLSRGDILAKIKGIQSGTVPADQQMKTSCGKVDLKTL